MNDKQKIQEAIDIISEFGGIEGGHHKQWVLDQVLRALMTPDDYEIFVAERTLGPNGESDYYSPWDRGIAP